MSVGQALHLADVDGLDSPHHRPQHSAALSDCITSTQWRRQLWGTVTSAPQLLTISF